LGPADIQEAKDSSYREADKKGNKNPSRMLEESFHWMTLHLGWRGSGRQSIDVSWRTAAVFTFARVTSTGSNCVTGGWVSP